MRDLPTSKKERPTGHVMQGSKTCKCGPRPRWALPPRHAFSLLRGIIFFVFLFFGSALLIEVRHHVEAAFHLCLSHSILLSCSCTRLRLQVDGGLNQTVVKFGQKKKKKKESCMGALCSLAHVHTELHLTLSVGRRGGLVELGTAGQAMKEEGRREKVKRVMPVIRCAELKMRQAFCKKGPFYGVTLSPPFHSSK